jgi:hypothetical protein
MIIAVIPLFLYPGFAGAISGDPSKNLSPHITTDISQNLGDPVVIEETKIDEITSDDPVQLSELINQANEEKAKNSFAVCIYVPDVLSTCILAATS